jgi:tRNA(Ile)-lysidine synthase
MASSRKQRRSDLLEQVREQLQRYAPRGSRLTLALSGGVDSMAALDLLARLAPAYPFTLSCLHVNHQISPNAGAWARFACAAAGRRGIPCSVKVVDLAPYRALGLEGAARAARYAAFARVNTDFVVLAHHQDDQAETVLLQLVRGAGLPGLAAMPAMRRQSARRAPSLLRPLLGASRVEILAYARERRLDWIEDETNADERRARNWVRHRVIPLLRELNPEAVANLARSASHLAEASELAQMLAANDAREATRGGRLSVAALSQLSRARAKNVLRSVLASVGIRAPEAVRLEELLQQLFTARQDAAVRMSFDGVDVRRYRDAVWLVSEQRAPARAFRASWDGGRSWPLPELGGTLRFKAVKGKGIARAALKGTGLEVRARSGGERFQPDVRRPRRALKGLLQEAGIPPWERERLPLLYRQGKLVIVPGVGVAAGLAAGPGEPGFVVSWEPLAVEPTTARKPVIK